MDYDFSGKKEDEKVILVIRQHPWVFFTLGLQIIAIIAIYLILFLFFKSGWATSWELIIAVILIVYMAFRAWFMWSNQVYVLTNERVITVDQSGWFGHSMSESNLENILFINHEVKGPIKTIFNFGDVRIRASGVVEDELVFTNVINPYEIQQEIVRAQKTLTGDKSPAQTEKNKQSGHVVLR